MRLFCKGVIWVLLPLLMLAACAGASPPPAPPPAVSQAIPSFSAVAIAPPVVSPSAAPVTPTLQPAPVYATVGAVGDLMVMQSQVRGAWNSEQSAYDFTDSFTGLLPYIGAVDVMCVNLETPLAGEDASYSGPAPLKPTPDADGETPRGPFQTFNAPDALALSLKQSGFDMVTTANNHCLDRDAAGLYRTASVLRQAELIQVGTYHSTEDRNTPRTAQVNGITLGFVAWTNSVNSYDAKLSEEEHSFAVGRTSDRARMAKDIQLCREAGAEFIIAFTHWDEEFFHTPIRRTRERAQWMLENGVDAIVGSHPHVVQPVEYMTVMRANGPYTGLVAYSLGNFLSNMAPSPRDFGMFLTLSIQKTPDGSVSLESYDILPVYCAKHRVNGRTLHEVLPAPADLGTVSASGTVTGDILAKLEEARAHVLHYAGGFQRAA